MGKICFDYDTGKVLCNDNKDMVYFTESVVDIYYGVSYYSRVDENIVLATFLKESGNVGNSSGGRLYSFPIGYTYKFWCIPDDVYDGEKMINLITNGKSNTVLVYDSYYRYYQENPSYNLEQTITYGKMLINNVQYRVYRTMTKSSSQRDFFVHSF